MKGIDSLTQKIYRFMGFSVQIIEIQSFEVLKQIDTMYNKVITHFYFNKRNVIKLSIVYLRFSFIIIKMCIMNTNTQIFFLNILYILFNREVTLQSYSLLYFTKEL